MSSNNTLLSRERVRHELRRWIIAAREEGHKAGKKEGWQQGLQQGARTILLILMKQRFGSISPRLEAQIESLSLDEMKALAEVVPHLRTTEDVQAWCDRLK